MNGKIYTRSVKERQLDMFQQWVAKDLMLCAIAVDHVTVNNAPARNQVCYTTKNVTGAIRNVKTAVMNNGDLY